jgi:TPR repeat protein
MKIQPLTFLLSLTFLFLFSGSVYGGDLQDGKDAYNRKDYKTAYRLFLPLAEQGNALAQYNLGVMYDREEGVPQDYKEAVKWYRLSADQGDASAQYNLGLMYAEGQGVLQDYAVAHMWFNFSGSNGYKKGVRNRNIIEKGMSPTQIEEAQRMARNWKPKK